MIERKQLKGLLQRYRALLEHYLQLKSVHESWLKAIKTLENALLDYSDIEDEIPLSDLKLRDAVSYTQKKIIPKKTIIVPFLQKQANTLQNRIVTINNFSEAMNTHIDELQQTLQNTDINETELLLETPVLEQQYQVLKLSHEINLEKNNDLHEIKQLQTLLQPVENLQGSPYEADELKKKMEKNPELQNLYQLMVLYQFTAVKIQETYVQVLESWKLVEKLAHELVNELDLEKQLKDELEQKLQQEKNETYTPLPMTPTYTPGGGFKGNKEKE